MVDVYSVIVPSCLQFWQIALHIHIFVPSMRNRLLVIKSKPKLWRSFSSNAGAPSVFEHNLQCEPVRKVETREECHWSHVKRAGVGTNGILDGTFLSENAHRTVLHHQMRCRIGVRTCLSAHPPLVCGFRARGVRGVSVGDPPPPPRGTLFY
jgi:hypothetical protein